MLTRRKFLQAGSAASVAACTAVAGPIVRAQAKSCIVLFLVGGPSQLETWDPKPDAPAEVRGPFRSISTSVTGIRIGEHLPRLASLAHRYAIVRTVHHAAAPVHEAGMQLLQTGRLSRPDREFPHFGASLAPFVILPFAIGDTGINVNHGQSAGNVTVQPTSTHLLCQADRERYGKTAFGDACARSVQLIEQGTRCVVVNMFDTVYDRITWDCHAERQGLTSTLDDYRRTLCPTLDRAFSALLDDLHQRGMLDETLVVAMGEMGRTPLVNANGGRDHWTNCWSIVLAGGGVRGGRVIGGSDRSGSEPVRQPVRCEQIAASIQFALGSDPPPPTVAAPIRELFAS